MSLNAPDHRNAAVRTVLWRETRLRRFLGAIAYPLVRLINRPSAAWLGQAIYDFALRCNGIAINFRGRHGLTIPEEAFLHRHVAALQGSVLLDVGANVGAYSALLRQLAPTARIIAFEPHPRSFATLQRALGETSIELMQMAIATTNGVLDLHDFAAADGSTQASLSRDAVELFAAETVAHRVTCRSLDDLLPELGISEVALLKIDTEGFDLAVLQGAAQAIREKRLRMIQFEFIPANIATRVTMRDIFAALPGYRISRLCLNGDLLPLDAYDVKRCEIYVTQNLIAQPR